MLTTEMPANRHTGGVLIALPTQMGIGPSLEAGGAPSPLDRGGRMPQSAPRPVTPPGDDPTALTSLSRVGGETFRPSAAKSSDGNSSPGAATGKPVCELLGIGTGHGHVGRRGGRIADSGPGAESLEALPCVRNHQSQSLRAGTTVSSRIKNVTISSNATRPVGRWSFPSVTPSAE